MGQKMTWDEIKMAFPDEWVAIANSEGDVSSPFGPISGEVIVHSRDETSFTKQLKSSSVDQSVDIRYTGDALPDNPIGPILWQNSNTNS